jgi:hypothetical protein
MVLVFRVDDTKSRGKIINLKNGGQNYNWSCDPG